MMLNVIAACGWGMGSSMIIKLKLQKIFKALNKEAKVEAMSAGQAKGMVNSVDVIICSKHLVYQFAKDGKAKIVGVKNLMDDQELTKAVKDNL